MLFRSYWKRLELGEVSKSEVLVGRFRDLFQEISVLHIDPLEFQEQYKDALGSVFFYQDNSYEICRELSNHVRQYIVTNGLTYTQEKKLRLSGLQDIMNDIFISEQLGYPKPNPLFFKGCFERISKCESDNILLIGDSLTSDIAGANAVSIDSCWYNPLEKENNTKYKPTYTITDLSQVKQFVN